MKAKILVCEKDNTLFIKFKGDIRYTDISGFDYLINSVFEENRKINLFIDMSEATSIDSTNFGLIAKLANWSIENVGIKPVVYCSNDNIIKIFDSMGFDALLTFIRSGIDHKLKFAEFQTEINNDQRLLAKKMLEAHQTLSDMNVSNRTTFKNVVEYLKKEVNRQDQEKLHD